MASSTQTMVAAPSLRNAHGPEDGIPLTSLVGAANSTPENDPPPPRGSHLQKALITFQLSGVNLTSSMINGLITVGLPTIAADLDLAPSLALWPASVSGLATATTLLLAGSIADVLGSRGVELLGCFANGAVMLGQGASRTGAELVGLRAIQGVALALHLAASVGVITEHVPEGRGRNIAFSCLGLSQVLGFSVGLVLGGIFVDTIGWRAGWYLSGGATLLLGVLGLWVLPRGRDGRKIGHVVRQIATTVDWVGAGLASAFMALLSYLLAVVSTDISRIRHTDSIVILCLSLIVLPSFVFWVHRQVRLGRPALIPNSLWKNTAFSSICITVALSSAVLNSLELFASLFFQDVQRLPALQASIRILPSMLIGVVLNVTTGFFVDRVPAFWLVTVSSLLCAGSPLLMAVIKPESTYWANGFVAQLLQPTSFDVLFTVGLIVVSNSFDDNNKSLAGAVFNAAAQFGSALGLGIMQVVSTLVTKQSGAEGIRAIMEGFRASFWTMFAFMILCAVLGGFGLGKTGKVGLKRD